jgi:hypothetical protein
VCLHSVSSRAANEICTGSLRGISTEAHHAMTVRMAFLFNHISCSRLQSRAGSDDIRRSSNCPSNTCDRLEDAISDRNVARLCVRQDLGHHRPLPTRPKLCQTPCVSTGCGFRKRSYIRLLSCGSSRLCRCYCPEINASDRDYRTLVQALPVHTKHYTALLATHPQFL